MTQSTTQNATFDSLVQGSLVELFAAYQVAAAPLPVVAGATSTLPEISAAVFLRTHEESDPGKLTLSLTS